MTIAGAPSCRSRGGISARLLVAALCLSLIWPIGAFGWKPVRQLTQEEVAQVWVGLTEDELDLFRLDLRRDGTGSGGVVFVSKEAIVFRISSWRYEGKRIEILLATADAAKTSFAKLKGELVGTEMELTISGKGWKQRLSLRQENVLERRWLSLKQAMSAASP